MDDIKLHLEKITKRYTKKVFSYLWDGFSYKINFVTKDRDQWKSARAMAALKAATEMADAVSGRSIKESPGLGFSLITNNATDALTYIGLAAANVKMDRARQELEAVKRANQKLRNVSTGGTGASAAFVKEIDVLVFNLTALHNAYTFVSSHKEFYTDASMYDAGISFEGLNLYQLLAHAANSRSGFIGDPNALKTDIDKRDLQWILPQLEGAGYIKYLDSYAYDSECYVTTGKYESAILRQKYWDEHPEEKIAEDRRIQENNIAAYARAETLLNNRKYYDAAVSFAKLDGYKDSMARSLEIWKTKILTNQHDNISVGHYAVTIDGRVLLSNLDDSNKMRNKWEELKDIKQIVSLGLGQFIALGYNGRLKTYVDYKNPLCEPISKIEKGEKKITSLVNYFSQCIGFLFEDGTAKFLGELETRSGSNSRKMSVNDIYWSSIEKIEIKNNCIVGLKKNGTILAVGSLEAYKNEFSSWTGIVDFKIGCLGAYIIAKTFGGKYLIAGEKPEKYDAVSSWTNVIDVIPNEVPIGISSNGSQIWGSTKHKRKNAQTARVFAQRCIVAANYESALKADGTIYTADRTKDFSDWQNVVYLESHFDHDLAICANGTVLVKEENAKYAPAAREAERWKLFDHIDTIQEERKRAQENSYDDYADKKISERKRHLKSAVFYFLLSAFFVSAGFFLAFHGDGESLPLTLLAGIGCIVFGVSEIKKMNNE